MNSIYISGRINEENVQTFIQNFNNLNFQQLITVYINTEGGDISCGLVIQDILNRHSNVIELVAVGNVMSTGLDIFLKVKAVDKRVLNFTIGMLHQASADMQLSSNGTMYNECDIAVKEQLLLIHEHWLSEFKGLGLTNKEIANYRKGNDVYFNTPRLQELIEYGKNKNR